MFSAPETTSCSSASSLHCHLFCRQKYDATSAAAAFSSSSQQRRRLHLHLNRPHPLILPFLSSFIYFNHLEDLSLNIPPPSLLLPSASPLLRMFYCFLLPIFLLLHLPLLSSPSISFLVLFLSLLPLLSLFTSFSLSCISPRLPP